jgi:hypothetical protein
MNPENFTDVSNAYIGAKIWLMVKETTEYSEESYLLGYNVMQIHWKSMTISGECVASNFQYVSWFLMHCMVLYPRRQNCSQPLLWEPQILHLLILWILWATFKLQIFITVTKDHRQTSCVIKWKHIYVHIFQEWKKPSTLHKKWSHLMF